MSRYAYADPPYLGCAKRHYSDHPDHAIYDTVEGHAALIDRLEFEFPDGWALSMGSSNLPSLLPIMPAGIRIGAWIKPFANYKPNVNPAYAWEPVIFKGGRKRGRYEMTIPDWVSASITLKRGCVGAKPDNFCFWIFRLLGILPEDDFIDLFPGSGAVSRAWDIYRRQMTFPKMGAKP